ncbi:MAG: HEAT repeat domain-containing protein [Verrucomicrobiaceae bacterium]|nr:HEAT repeat domain-containing protein [Verrucomicrobiaceae bacterium]
MALIPHRLRRFFWRTLFLALGLGCFAWLSFRMVTDFRTRRPLVRQAPATTLPAASVSPTLTAEQDEKAWEVQRAFAARQTVETGTDAEALEAIRLMGDLSTAAAVNTLEMIAADANWPAELRKEAIQSLRRIHTSRAARALENLLPHVVTDEELLTETYAALGDHPWNEIEDVFEPVLREGSTSTSTVRIAATEALSRSTAEALPTLHRLVESDSDADVRAAAAWAMSCVRADQTYGPALAELAKKEPEIMVRRRIYEALLVQTDNPAADMAPLIHAEQDISARVAGLNALGDSVGRSMDEKKMAVFDAEDVPELVRIAHSEETLNLRMRAVFALRRAGTAAALNALTQISKTHPTPQVARAAYNGAKTTAL